MPEELFGPKGHPRAPQAVFNFYKVLLEGAFSLETVAKKRPRGAFYFLKFLCFQFFYIIHKQCFGGYVFGPKDRPKNAPRTPKVSPKLAHKAPSCECALVSPHTNG